MKVTIIATSSEGSHQKELKAAAEKKGIKASIKNLTPEDFNDNKAKAKLQGAIIWRSSNLDLRSERTSLLPLLERKTMASRSLFTLPMTKYKYFQQQMLSQESATKAWSIPTYRYRTKKALLESISAGKIALPVIAKPNDGSRGENISLIRTKEDVKGLEAIADFVFQEFIPNDCDWRVIVVGGSAVGVLRRQAQDGHYLNNVSQGAKAVVETDPATLISLRKIAVKAASVFELSFCGVDIIRNLETGKYSILEVNTAPQWRDEFGFQNVTGINVPDVVMDWILAKENPNKLPLPQLVEQYYKDRIHTISDDAFHFASRLWLWSKDEWARERLDEYKAGYIGADAAGIERTIESIVDRVGNGPLTVNQEKAYRKESFEKYNKLPLYNNLLFKVVFCDTIYDTDIRPFVRKHVSDKDFLDLFAQLIEDHDAVRLLSTHAINFFYLLKNYFKDKLSLSSAVLVDPHELIELLPGYAELEKAGKVSAADSRKLQIYLLTHAIIGESRFYARKVKATPFRELCVKIEEIIEADYYDVTLDNKLEFLVCAELCGYKSKLRRIIGQEAEMSVSWAGNFLVDTINSRGASRAKHGIQVSEHRNVLYLMSQRPFDAPVATSATKKTKAPLRKIGRLARIGIADAGIRRVIARVDSGATRSSIAASNVYVDESGVLRYTLMYPESPLYNGKELVARDYGTIQVKNTSAQTQRYAVTMRVEVDGIEEDIRFTLADRQHMLYPVLLGREFLKGKYQVDISQQFAKPKKVVSEDK